MPQDMDSWLQSDQSGQVLDDVWCEASSYLHLNN